MLIEPTPDGLFCAAGGFHIDPWQPVTRAIITHAHGDHLRPGSQSYLCAAPGLSVVLRRLPPEAHVTGLPYGATVALDSGRLVSPASRAAMMAPARAPDGRALPYGIGWYVQQHAGRTLVWHAGWWPEAYSALYLKVPEEGVTLILLANSDGLTAPFGLETGDVTASIFARTFLQAFLP
jgi:CubicO group peptidase (beta-lactamase class C family)